MTEDTCGYPTANGNPCAHPMTDDGDPNRCWLQAHNDAEVDREDGRPKLITEHKERIIYTAVSSGLKVEHQASLASVSPDTLRRHACCLDTLREPEITVDDPCNFCESYAQAHARGAMEVLDDCRPEFVAAASYGYTKREQVEVMGEDGGPVETEVVIGGDEPADDQD